ncbi:hypothetical protein OG992_18575 [Micromonospora sp. NBC_00362]|uniref:hypothetical protein n=1 Tax=Micromonospora sp. NBC_00362 TaxID=2975975 RepID=UPI0022552F37|nr:hypothetical protein [Micromonospora sp. NBC_00362]MCX5119194.1 hypothetical protein [Micromonospora sp. NBC_00362]
MRTCWHIWRWRHKHQGGTHCAPCCVFRPYRTNAERVTRFRRLAGVSGGFAFVGAVMLSLRLLGAVTDLGIPLILGPLGMLLFLPTWIVALLANHLAEHYSEAA